MVRAKNEAVEVISGEVMKKIRGEGAEEVIATEVQHTFFTILQNLSLEKLDQKLEKLRDKEVKGELSGDDLDWFNKLRSLHAAKTAEIAKNVTEVFKLAGEGSVVKANNLSKKLIDEGVEGLSKVVSDEQVLEIRKFAKDASGVVSELHKLPKRSEDELMRDKSIPTKEREQLIELRRSKLLKAEQVTSIGKKLDKDLGGDKRREDVQHEIVKYGQRVEEEGKGNILKDISEVQKQNATRAENFDKNIVGKTEDKEELKKAVQRTVAGREIAPIVEDLLENGDQRVRELVKQVEGGGQGRREIQRYGQELKKVEKVLKNERVEAGLRADKNGKLEKKASRLQLGGGEWELGTLRKGASKKERLDYVANMVLGDQPWSEEERIDLIAQALNIPASERARAETIWGEISAWDKKFEKFTEKTVDLRNRLEEALLPPHQRELIAAAQEVLQAHNEGRDPYYRTRGVLGSNVISAGERDEDTVLNEFGKEIQKQMDEYDLRVYVGTDRDGNPKYRAETSTEYWQRRKMEGTIPPGYGMNGRSIELGRITGGRKFAELSDAERPVIVAKVRTGIEDMVKRIMATNDSSRAAPNQPLAWEVNDMMSWLETKEDAEFRDLWQARLASYDQSAVLGSVGKKDAHEQIAGYIPREWLAILFEDTLDFGNYRGLDGKLEQYHLSSKHVHAMLEERVPGAKDNNDIWLGRILGANSLDQVGLEKRRFMAFLLGEQRGVEFAYDKEGNFSIVDNPNNPENMKRATSMINGDMVKIFREVGLDDDGNFLGRKDKDGNLINDPYEKYEKYDLFAQNWFFINQSMTRHRIELRENELERGGNEKGWWPQVVNAFRKLHGRSARDYTEEKQMGMPSSRSAVDSYWRSFPAWKLMAKDTEGNYFVIHKLMEAADKAAGGKLTKDQKDNFVAMFEHIAYMPERFEIGKKLRTKDWKEGEVEHGYGGGLRATADVRHMEVGEKNVIKKLFHNMDQFDRFQSDQFDWKPILQLMAPNKLASLPDNVDLTGDVGLETFLNNYNVNELMDYTTLMQGFWVDFLTYTQTQAKIWDNTAELVTNLANPQLQTAVIKQIRGFDDLLANVKSVEWTAKIINETGMDLTGYESVVNLKGEESSKKWRIKEEIILRGDDEETRKRKEDANKANKIEAERQKAQELGYKVLSNGYVVDANGHYSARPDKVPFWKDLADPHAIHPKGSPWIGRDFIGVSWEDRRDLIFGYLRTFNISDPKIWRQVHARFNAAMYWGAELDATEAPTMRNIIKHLNKHPLKYALLPYTLLRGTYVDAPISLATVMAGWGPIGKQLGRIFEV